MKFKLFVLLLTIVFGTPTILNAQTVNVIEATNIRELQRLSQIWEQERTAQMNLALKRAAELGLEIRSVYENGEITELQGISENGALIYNTTGNLDAARTVSTADVWPGGSAGFTLSGDSMIVGEWDGGAVRASHQELVGRVTQVDNPSSIIDHATHVAGTIMGAGVDTSAKGMAYTARLHAYDWNSDNAEMATAASNGLLISSHSYGIVTGWRYNGGTSQYEWWGDTTISGSEDYNFGFYTSSARAWDQIARNAPYYLIVKSAGNDRGDNSTGRHYLPWYGVYSSTSRPADGGTSGYDCISSYSGAKNILTIGAVDAIPSGYSGPSSVVMSSFSGWGPTDDGRIKPDLVANGVGVYSSLATNDSAYASWNGTSMSTPSASGSLILLQQHYLNERGSNMKAATLKALAIHTANEAGNSTGPDYEFGWGLLNTAGAAMHISDTSGNKDMFEGNIINNTPISLRFSDPDSMAIRITMCWTDVAGTPVSPSLDPTNLMLVNDLDMRVIRDSDSSIYYPYTLNPSSPSSAATTGDNTRDNVEQIFIATPSPGNYTLVISHKSSLTGGNSQDFSIILDGGRIEPIPVVCSQVVDSFPAIYNFDQLSNCSSTSAAACPLPSSVKWSNDTLDDIDWKVYSGQTTSNSTGPNGDFTGVNGGGKYLYTESSTNGTGFPGKRAVLNAPCFNLDTLTNSELSFAYNMNGSAMGSLSVEIISGFAWSQLWTRSGHQDTSWLQATVDLSAYDGDTIQLRFVGITGSSFTSDMAIDAIEIRKMNPCPDPTNVIVYDITDTTATFTWGSSAFFWKLGFGLADSVSTLNATINFNPVRIINLQPNTTYDFYIQDSCGSGFESNRIGPLRFTTTGPLFNPSECGMMLNIPDNSCSSTDPVRINVSTGIGTQMGMDVQLKEVNLIIDHTYDADLEITLASPSNDTVVLSSFNGSSGNNYGNPSDTTCNQYTSFNMMASTSIVSGFAPFIGSYLPEDSLSRFNTGGNPNGIWELLICDNASLDTGYLSYVELVFECMPSVAYISNSGSDTICAGNSAVLNVTSGFQYQWYRNGQLIAGSTSDTINITQSGNYNVMVTNSNNCSDSAQESRTIVVNALPVVSISSSNNPFCQGDSALLTTASSGTKQWYKNGNFISGQTSSSMYATTSGSYNVLVTDGNACSDSSSNPIIVVVNPLPQVNITASGSTTFCDGDSINLTSTQGNFYQWYKDGNAIVGAVASDINVRTAGRFNVIVTNQNACSDSASNPVSVVVNALPQVHILATDTILCEGESATFATVNGISYQWYVDGSIIPGGIQANIVVSSAGFYNVMVTDSNNCSDSAAQGQQIIVNDLPIVSLDPLSDVCDTDDPFLLLGGIPANGRFSGTSVTGSPGVYYFDPGIAGPGNHLITYAFTDQNFCSDSASQTIFVKNCVGIVKRNGDKDITIYPNPSDGLLKIKIQPSVNGNFNIQVFDVNAQIVYSKEYVGKNDGSEVQLDLRYLAKGIYFVQLQLEDEDYFQKVILD